jgi:ubiquinone/menaquinone biosynthesis C-methylase UbiE
VQRMEATCASMTRRWELTDEEWDRVNHIRAQPISSRAALKLLVRRPSLIREVTRDLIVNAKQGMWSSSALVWTLDSERVRQAVPDAARGVGFTDEKPFLSVLLPLVEDRARVLDVGGGDGRLSRHVAPVVEEIVVSDVAPTMLHEAAENLAAYPRASTHLSNGLTLEPLADKSFDLAFAQGVLPYLDVNQGLALLDEMRRVVKPDGRIVVNAFTIDRPEWAAAQLESVRRSAHRGRFSGGLFRAYCEAQLEAMVRTAGFEIETTTYAGETDKRRLPYIIVGGPTADVRGPLDRRPAVAADRRPGPGS